MTTPNYDMYAKLDELGNIVRPSVNVQLDDGRWIINANRNDAWLAANGYEEHTQEWFDEHTPTPEPYVRQRCTKYQLVTCLKTYFPALLISLRTAYAANEDLQFYWNTVQDLDRANADFQNITAQLGITSNDIDDIFNKITGEEP